MWITRTYPSQMQVRVNLDNVTRIVFSKEEIHFVHNGLKMLTWDFKEDPDQFFVLRDQIREFTDTPEMRKRRKERAGRKTYLIRLIAEIESRWGRPHDNFANMGWSDKLMEGWEETCANLIVEYKKELEGLALD